MDQLVSFPDPSTITPEIAACVVAAIQAPAGTVPDTCQAHCAAHVYLVAHGQLLPDAQQPPIPCKKLTAGQKEKAIAELKKFGAKGKAAGVIDWSAIITAVLALLAQIFGIVVTPPAPTPAG